MNPFGALVHLDHLLFHFRLGFGGGFFGGGGGSFGTGVFFGGGSSLKRSFGGCGRWRRCRCRFGRGGAFCGGRSGFCRRDFLVFLRCMLCF